jgi:hypothetical protein
LGEAVGTVLLASLGIQLLTNPTNFTKMDAAELVSYIAVALLIRQIPVGPQAIDISLKYKPAWTPAQMAEADAKIESLNQIAKQNLAINSDAVRKGTSARAIYEEYTGEEVPGGYDVDHIHDIQLDGDELDPTNMAPLDQSVNRSLGSQIYHALKDVPKGTRIRKFTISH